MIDLTSTVAHYKPQYTEQKPVEIKLKPCPFCGSQSIKYEEEDYCNQHTYCYTVAIIKCECGAQVRKVDSSKEEVSKIWNKRNKGEVR